MFVLFLNCFNTGILVAEWLQFVGVHKLRLKRMCCRYLIFILKTDSHTLRMSENRGGVAPCLTPRWTPKA